MTSTIGKQTSLRETAATLPGKPVAMPYEMRSEVTWIDFGNRTNPLGTPKTFVQALHTALVDGEHNYVPDKDGRAFRHALASFTGVSAENILVGTSPTQLLTYAACAFDYCTAGITVPCPMSYEIALGNAGHRIQPLVNTVSFAPVSSFYAQQQGQFQGIVLGNPTYPTSRLVPRQTLANYLEACDWVIVDESAIELTIGSDSAIPFIERYPNLIVIQSASMTFGMPGVPLAYMVAHEEMISHIEQYYAGEDIGMFGEVLSRHIGMQGDYLEQTHDYLDKEIPWMQCMLSLLPGVAIFPAEGNFVLCEFNPRESMRLGARNCAELVTSLQLAGFHVDDLDDTVGLPRNTFFCVSVRSHEENERLLAAMRAILKSID